MYLANGDTAFAYIIAGAQGGGKRFAVVMPLQSVFTSYIRALRDLAARYRLGRDAVCLAV
jgi:hypothetical protein